MSSWARWPWRPYTRGGSLFDGMADTLNRLEQNHASYKILFFEASNEAIVKRYKETRRKHPLVGRFDDSLLASIQRERELLAPLRLRADYIIDTTTTSPAQLRERLASLFLGDSVLGMKIAPACPLASNTARPPKRISSLTCGACPTPFISTPCAGSPGRTSRWPTTCWRRRKPKGFVERMFSLIDYLVPLYANEGKSSLVIAVGCTGGKHRSVALAELLSAHLAERGSHASAIHRDIDKGRTV